MFSLYLSIQKYVNKNKNEKRERVKKKKKRNEKGELHGKIFLHRFQQRQLMMIEYEPILSFSSFLFRWEMKKGWWGRRRIREGERGICMYVFESHIPDPPGTSREKKKGETGREGKLVRVDRSEERYKVCHQDKLLLIISLFPILSLACLLRSLSIHLLRFPDLSNGQFRGLRPFRPIAPQRSS